MAKQNTKEWWGKFWWSMLAAFLCFGGLIAVWWVGNHFLGWFWGLLIVIALIAGIVLSKGYADDD
jgi:hypothetical protein